MAVKFLISFSNSTSTREILDDFSHFQLREDIYSHDAIWDICKYVSPLIWWKGFVY